ncbi:MAG: dockerin type I domain-containing protein [Haloarculaceae archaeon]
MSTSHWVTALLLTVLVVGAGTAAGTVGSTAQVHTGDRSQLAAQQGAIEPVTAAGTASTAARTYDHTARNGVAIDDGTAYVIENDEIVQIDLATGETVGSIAAPDGTDQGLAYGDGSLWYSDAATDAYDGKILELDPETGEVRSEINTFYDPRALAFGDGHLWATEVTGIPDTLVKFAPGGTQVSRSDMDDPVGDAGTSPNGLAYYGGSIWVGTGSGLYELDTDGSIVQQAAEQSGGFTGLGGSETALYGPGPDGDLTVLRGEARTQPTVSLQPAETTVTPGESVTVEIVVGGITQGVGSYDLTVNSSNAAAVEFTGATTRIGTGSTSVAGDGSGARLGAFNGQTDDTGPVTIGTVTVRGGALGTADLSLDVRSVSNESGAQYDFATESASLTVQGPRVPPSDRPATDPDDDGVYEDVNGDGTVTPADATLLANAIAADRADLQRRFFDLNGDGRLSVTDVTTLSDAVAAGSIPPARSGADASLALQPANGTVGVDGSTTYEVVARDLNATAGVGAYALTVSVDNASRARVSTASGALGGTTAVDVASDGSRVTLLAFDANTTTAQHRAIATGDEVVLARVNVTGVATGTARLGVTGRSLSTESGTDRYRIAQATGATVTVEETAPTIGSGPATDPDDDGLYEDVNGDGEATPGDATVLFDAVFSRDPAVLDNPELFDFSGEGEVTAGDATVLFNEVFVVS